MTRASRLYHFLQGPGIRKSLARSLLQSVVVKATAFCTVNFLMSIVRRMTTRKSTASYLAGRLRRRLSLTRGIRNKSEGGRISNSSYDGSRLGWMEAVSPRRDFGKFEGSENVKLQMLKRRPHASAYLLSSPCHRSLLLL